MNEEEKESLLDEVNRIISDTPAQPGRVLQERMLRVVVQLLANEGYERDPAYNNKERPFDFLAFRPVTPEHDAYHVGVQFNFLGSRVPIGEREIRGALGAGVSEHIDRAMLVTNSPFTKRALELHSRVRPVELVLADYDFIRGWAERWATQKENLPDKVKQFIRDLSRRIAGKIAQNPRVLDRLEWFDMERVLAEVFEGLGFEVELTRPSKDGGKDIVLKAIIRGCRHEYIVEVKHWQCGKRVGARAVRHFLNVIVREHRDGGLFLSTSGYCQNAFEQLSEIETKRLRFGGEEKIVSLCKSYVRAKGGIWSPPERLPEILYEGTTLPNTKFVTGRLK